VFERSLYEENSQLRFLFDVSLVQEIVKKTYFYQTFMCD
jgi:hypothetical protein